MSQWIEFLLEDDKICNIPQVYVTTQSLDADYFAGLGFSQGAYFKI